MTTQLPVTPPTVRAVLIRANGCTCTFNADGWVDFATRALAEYDRENQYVKDGHSLAPYIKAFSSVTSNGKAPTLEHHLFSDLRASLDSGLLLSIDNGDWRE